MKLFVDVNDLACPTSAAPISWLPSTNDPLWMALAERVVPVDPVAAVLAGSGFASGLAYTTAESTAA